MFLMYNKLLIWLSLFTGNSNEYICKYWKNNDISFVTNQLIYSLIYIIVTLCKIV